MAQLHIWQKEPEFGQVKGESADFIAWDHKGVVIVWPDGHRSRLQWQELRAACHCADCQKRQELLTRTQSHLTSSQKESQPFSY